MNQKKKASKKNSQNLYKLENEKLNKQIDELKSQLQYLQADFENFKKQNEKQLIQYKKYAASSILHEFLPILDSIDEAKKHDKELSKGIILIFDQLKELTKRSGLHPMECLGKKFDPHEHEVMMQIDSTKESGTIIEVLQKGYFLEDKVLRYAKVKTSK